MAYDRAFRPLSDAVSVTQTGSSIATDISALNGTRQVRFVNTGAALMYVKFGDSTVTVSSTDGTPILPNSALVLTAMPGDTHFATIGTATQVLVAQVGVGL